MANLNFPANPRNREIYPYPPVPGVNTFVYNEERNIWNRLTIPTIAELPGNVVIISEDAPTQRENTQTLAEGDLWYIPSSEELKVYSGGNWADFSYAQLDSPNFIGSPTSPTQSLTDSSDNIATTRFTTEKINSVSTREIIDLGEEVVIDCSLGNYFIKNTTTNTDFVFTNAPSGVAYAFVLRVTHGNSTITWPTSVSWSEDDGAPVLAPSKDNLFLFITEDGGINWKGSYVINYPQ